MIEQTALIVSKWNYTVPNNSIGNDSKLTSSISLDVMRKRTATKKGIACRFSCEFFFEEQTILEYMAEDSYVIDLDEIIDKAELQTMITNSYNKFKERFDFKKLGTVLQDKTLLPFDDRKYDLDPILLLLKS